MEKETGHTAQSTQEIVAGIGLVMHSALGVGASVAKIAAESTAQGRPMPTPGVDDPVGAIVHYGTETLRNMASIVVGGVNAVRGGGFGFRPGTASAAEKPVSAEHATLPRARQGATLRVPLSIENPGSSPKELGELQCAIETLEPAREGDASALPHSAIRLSPQSLTIQPKDFEKLTVYMDIPTTATPGRYRAVITSMQSGFRTDLGFEVIAATT